MKALLALVFAIVILDLQGCGKKLAFPDQSTVPATRKSALDGTWRLVTGNVTQVFRIDSGRMYYYNRQKPPRGVRQEVAPVLSSELKSATDYVRRPGDVIAMGIRDTDDPRNFSCKTAVYDIKKRGLDFVPGQLRIVSESRIVLKALSKAGAGAVETVEERFDKVSLDDETLFLGSLYPGNGRVAVIQPRRPEAAPVQRAKPAKARKTTVIPPDKMEADGRLSDSAKEFIAQTVRNSRDADGSVEVRYPPNTSERIVRALRELGADVSENDDNSLYEIVIIIIKPNSE